MTFVFDASALLSYLEREPGYESVKELLTKASQYQKNILMTSVNWGEVCYILKKHYTIGEAEKILNVVRTFPIEIVFVDRNLAEMASSYKVTGRLPYVDSFAAALTKLKDGELVTGDKEFFSVKSEIKIMWIK